MSKRSYQKHEEKKLPSETQNELIIDSEDTYKDIDNIFYVHPSHLNMLKSISNNQFTSVSIKNSSVDDISAYALMNLYGKLKTGAKVEMIIYQPITVMQSLDSKQIEAHCEHVGFEDISSENTMYTSEKNNIQYPTISVVCYKPSANKDNQRIEMRKEVKKNNYCNYNL